MFVSGERSQAIQDDGWIAASLVGGWTLPRKVQPRPGDGASRPILAMTAHIKRSSLRRLGKACKAWSMSLARAKWRTARTR